MGVPRGRLIGDATWTLDRDATWTLDGIATWTLDGSATWMLDWSATWNLDGDVACLPVAGSVVSSRIVLSRELVHGQLATFLPLVLTCACTPYDSMTSSRSHSLSLSNRPRYWLVQVLANGRGSGFWFQPVRTKAS